MTRQELCDWIDDLMLDGFSFEQAVRYIEAIVRWHQEYGS